MRRIASLWIPHWPTDRLWRRLRARAERRGRAALASLPSAEEVAFAFTRSGAGGIRLAALSPGAERAGLLAGQLLADARALEPSLRTAPLTPEADARALGRLAAWLGRYSPWIACGREAVETGGAGTDHLFLDITGCAHLFGGEGALARDLLARLAGFGIGARLAVASTPGAAWALSHHGGRRLYLCPEDERRAALAPLPVAGLRLPRPLVEELGRVGLRRIGDLAGLARAGLARRFGLDLVRQYDRALGAEPEPIGPEAPVVPYRARLVSAEPLLGVEALCEGARRLVEDLVPHLEKDGKGLRAGALHLFRVDGRRLTLPVRTARPTRSAAHLIRLLTERIEAEAGHLDLGFGVDALSFDVPLAEPLAAASPGLPALAQAEEAGAGEGIFELADRLANRYGAGVLTRARAGGSHLPEAAVVEVPVFERAEAGGAAPALVFARAGAPARPPLILPRPEPIEVVAEVPDGPPRIFRWRKVSRRVARAEGPERIAPEWWRQERGLTRDYYALEDETGNRFWVYRAGLYERESAEPRWFLHGLFA